MASITGFQEHALADLIRFVRQSSEFYRYIWADVPRDATSLEELPPLRHDAFWEANTTNFATNRLLTGSVVDGGIFRSGGTTSEPKVSAYTRDELHVITRQVADCLVRAGVVPGDRVANLMYNGELYMGFLLLALAWLDSTAPYVQLPISGVTAGGVEGMTAPMREFGATVAVAMPTTLLRIADHLCGGPAETRRPLPSVRLLVYGGEALYEDQRALLARAFPNATVRPLMYGSTDGGLIAIPTHDGQLEARVGGPVYAPNVPNAVVEILREGGDAVTEPGERGLVHVTQLTRRLMPTIRYPTGDVAEWVDEGRKLFVLRGRDVVGVRIGPSSYDFRALRSMTLRVIGTELVQGFQVVVRRVNGKDQLVLRVALQVSTLDQEGISARVADALSQESPEYASDVESGYINKLLIEFTRIEDLLYHPRTGKSRDVVDQRY